MRTRDELRAEIDEIDAEILRLLNERARLVVEIAKRKRDEGAPILDRERELAVVQRACAASEGPLPRPSIRRIFKALMRESRLLQLRTWRRADASRDPEKAHE